MAGSIDLSAVCWTGKKQDGAVATLESEKIVRLGGGCPGCRRPTTLCAAYVALLAVIAE